VSSADNSGVAQISLSRLVLAFVQSKLAALAMLEAKKERNEKSRIVRIFMPYCLPW
jgi:hypothetical protein